MQVFTLTEENLSEVAKISGRHELDLKCMLAEGQEKGKKINVIVERPDIPEGFGRVN